MKTIDIKFSQLCDEIDHWKEEAEYWKDKFKSLDLEMRNRLAKDFQESKRGIGQMLSLALSVKEGKDGSLVIPKEKRKSLSKTLTNK